MMFKMKLQQESLISSLTELEYSYLKLSGKTQNVQKRVNNIEKDLNEIESLLSCNNAIVITAINILCVAEIRFLDSLCDNCPDERNYYGAVSDIISDINHDSASNALKMAWNEMKSFWHVRYMNRIIRIFANTCTTVVHKEHTPETYKAMTAEEVRKVFEAVHIKETLTSASTKMPQFLIKRVIGLHMLTAVLCEDETVKNTE